MSRVRSSLFALVATSGSLIGQEDTEVSQADILDIKDPIFMLDPMLLPPLVRRMPRHALRLKLL